MKTLKTIFAIGLLGICSFAAAQWQWLDKDGRKVFSDRAPPPHVEEKSILKRPGGLRVRSQPADAEGGAAVAATPASGPKLTPADKELANKKKIAEDVEKASRKAEEEKIAKAKVENCARAKQAKANMDSGVRIGQINVAGEREVMDDAARAVESKRIQAIMATDCL
jgi:hypothetical protein